MCIADQLATSFITPFGAYCYQMMPFGIKNAGATFQRCMQRVFGELIDRIIEAYVDDIVVKSKKTRDLVPDLTEVFAKLRQHGVKLNPEKCVLGVPRGMLLGFVMSERGIEANLEKISDIMGMGLIKNMKGVQRVTGCLAALSRFIARLKEHSLPLYKLMKKSNHFTWTSEVQEALDSLKNVLKVLRYGLLRPLKSQCSYTSHRQPKWSVRCWWSSEKSLGGLKRCNDQCTSSARYSSLQDALLPNAEACIRDIDDQAQTQALF
jgi:hypothetical protein